MKNQNKIAMELSDFNNQGRVINLENITEFSPQIKHLSEEEFNKSFFNDEHFIISDVSLRKYIIDCNAKIQENIEKSEDSSELMKSFRESLSKLERVHVIDPFGKNFVFFVGRKEQVREAKEQAELSKSEENDIEKGHIESNLSYQFSFEKSGKDLVEVATAKIRELESKIIDTEEDMSTHLEGCSTKPTFKIGSDDYRLKGMVDVKDIPKMFDWECCNFYEEKTSNTMYAQSSNSMRTGAKTKEEANCCREYNRAAEHLLGLLVDKKFLETIVRNVKPTDKYKLDARAAAALGF